MSLQEARLAWIALACAVALSGCHNRFITIGPRPDSAQDVISSRPAVVVDTSDWVGYRVQEGDTIARLARCSDTSVERLAAGNSLADPDAVRAGQPVLLPRAHRCADVEGPVRAVAAPAPAAAPTCKPPRAPAKLLSRARAQLEEGTDRQDAADFSGALGLARECAAALRPYALDPDADGMRARCHALAATAAAGLGQRELAVEEFRRAFAVDPKLELDPAAESPRIQELVQAARS